MLPNTPVRSMVDFVFRLIWSSPRMLRSSALAASFPGISVFGLSKSDFAMIMLIDFAAPILFDTNL